MHSYAPREVELLRDALGLDSADTVSFVSREPLGDGSVAGFHVSAKEGAEAPLTYFVDTSRRPVDRETGFVQGSLEAPDARVWLHPADPHLPALAAVAFGHAAEALLTRLQLTVTGPPEFAAYRPGRRAVLRVPTGVGATWVKVVPPLHIARLVATHHELQARGVPVPLVVGWSDEGLLVLEQASGTPATDAAWEAEALLDEVDRLRSALAAVPLRVAARTDLARRRDWYVERLFAIVDGERADRVARLGERIRVAWQDSAVRATIHGDLHFGQLFLGDDLSIAAVIDVDTAGTGLADDDAAAFVSHAVASALLTPATRAGRLWELARVAMRRWGTAAGPKGVHTRTATHLLGHALGAWEAGAVPRADALLAAAAAALDGDIEPVDLVGHASEVETASRKSGLIESFERS